MTISRLLVQLALVCLLWSSVTCAPHDHSVSTSKSADTDRKTEDSRPAPPPEVPKEIKQRVDAALQNVRSRDLHRQHSFWTVFHGILGVGPHAATLFDSKTGKRVKAMDYIREGGELRGLEFRPEGGGLLDVVTMAGSGVGQGHQDQFIAEMAQWGMPLDAPFRVQGKDYTFDAFVRHAKDRVSLRASQELSWAIIIVAQYYGTDLSWTNSRDERVTFEEVVDYELKQPIKESPVCGGTHRLFGLSWAYHLHMAKGGKKTGVWKDVESLTREYVALARKLQNKDGAFSTEYFRGPGNNRQDLQLRIHSTGHILEWLALALSDKELREPWVQDAVHALVLMILENRDQGLDGGALYHAAHGLAIYRLRVFGPYDEHPPLAPPPPP